MWAPSVRVGLINSRTFLKKSRLVLAGLLLSGGLWAAGGSAGSLMESLKGAKAGGFEYIHYDRSGKVLWELSGLSPVFTKDEKVEIVQPRLKIPVDGQEVMGEMLAGRAKVDIEAQQCWLSDNVLVKHLEGVRVDAYRLRFDMEKQMISFEGAFRLSKDFFEVQGRDGRYALESGNLVTSGRTQMEITR